MQKAGSHRALDDIRESVNELQFYPPEHIFLPAGSVAIPAAPAAATEPTATVEPSPAG